MKLLTLLSSASTPRGTAMPGDQSKGLGKQVWRSALNEPHGQRVSLGALDLSAPQPTRL